MSDENEETPATPELPQTMEEFFQDYANQPNESDGLTGAVNDAPDYDYEVG